MDRLCEQLLPSLILLMGATVKVRIINVPSVIEFLFPKEPRKDGEVERFISHTTAL